MEVTCKPVYYRRAEDEVLVPAEEAQRTGKLTVSGVVLSIVEPKGLSGEVFAFHFDFPEAWDYWYRPGFLYRGQIQTNYIGSLAFMSDSGFFIPTQLTGKLPSADPEALRTFLRHPAWCDRCAAALKEQFGDAALFNALYGFLTDTNRSPAGRADQLRAARLLVHFQPACNVSLHKAIADTLLTWDESVREWPLYLWRSFGRDALVQTLDQFGEGKLTEAQRDAIYYWRYWLSGTQTNLVEQPKE
jgi:hypothetical protein